MENTNKTYPNGESTHDHLKKRNHVSLFSPESGVPIGSTLSKPEVIWLQKEENRTKIQGPGNLWISNKPLWVSDGSKRKQKGDESGNRGTSPKVHREKKYVVVGMRGTQIQNFHGAYRENTQVTSNSLRRSFMGDRPKPSKPKEE